MRLKLSNEEADFLFNYLSSTVIHADMSGDYKDTQKWILYHRIKDELTIRRLQSTNKIKEFEERLSNIEKLLKEKNSSCRCTPGFNAQAGD